MFYQNRNKLIENYLKSNIKMFDLPDSFIKMWKVSMHILGNKLLTWKNFPTLLSHR